MEENKKNIIINQPVNWRAYSVIKAEAILSGKKIQDVVNEALIYYSTHVLKHKTTI